MRKSVTNGSEGRISFKNPKTHSSNDIRSQDFIIVTDSLLTNCDSKAEVPLDELQHDFFGCTNVSYSY